MCLTVHTSHTIDFNGDCRFVIQNPIIPGFYPDPSVCRVGIDYYIVTSSFEYFPGIPIFHSRDLVHWRQLGHVLDRDEQLDLRTTGSSGGVWAPTIRCHNGMYFVVYTLAGAGNFLVTAADPAGPWSNPVEIGTPPVDSSNDTETQTGIDPSLFFDDDGTCYLTTGWNAQSVINPVTGRRLSEIQIVWEGGSGGGYLEAPHLYRIGRWYYLLVAEGGTGRGHMVSIARSESPWGPYEPCPRNPILSNRSEGASPVQATGHGDLVQTHDGGWWMVYLAIREKRGPFPRVHNLGRETFLAPVVWDDDGWPVVDGDGRARLDIEVAGLPEQTWSDSPVRDDFDGQDLPMHYNFRRNPVPDSCSLTERTGSLTLHGTGASLDAVLPLAFTARRQQHDEFTARALVELDDDAVSSEAGLAVTMNESHHYEIGIVQGNGVRQVMVRHRIGHLSQVVAQEAIPEGPIILEIVGDRDAYHFAWSTPTGSTPTGAAHTSVVPSVATLSGATSNGISRTIASGGARYLSTEVAGGFTGVYVGMYVVDGTAHFDWFEYRGEE
jgi:xylan 1,4-beta-xylosidase